MGLGLGRLSLPNFMVFFKPELSQYEFPVVFCHNYMASSASGAPCFCPLSQGRFIAAFFPSVGALHPALSFVVPTPSLHLTLSYPALASPMQLDHYSSEMWTHGLHRKIFHISYLVLISPLLVLSMGALHTAVSFVVPTPPLHLTILPYLLALTHILTDAFCWGQGSSFTLWVQDGCSKLLTD